MLRFYADLSEAGRSEVGAGGQFAVFLDGRIVSAPRFAETPPGDTGVVTGLDEATARSLAERLRR